MQTLLVTTSTCVNSGASATVSSGVTLYYNSSGQCYYSGNRLDLARIEESNPSNRPYVWFEPQQDVDPATIDQVSQCPSTNNGYYTYTSDSSMSGRFKLDFSVPSTAGDEWGWNFYELSLPPKLKIKIRIKRPA